MSPKTPVVYHQREHQRGRDAVRPSGATDSRGVLGCDMRDRPIAIDGRLLAYRRGGISRYVTGLITHLPAVAPDLRFRVVLNRAADVPIPTLAVRTPPHLRWERWMLGAELTVRRPALIHSTDFIPPRAPGIPRVITVHDLAFLENPELLDRDANRYYRQLLGAAETASKIIAVSDATRAAVLRLLNVDHERVVAIHNGVDDAFFSGDLIPSIDVLRREAGQEVAARIAAARPVLLAVGTVEPRKRYDLLVETYRRLASRYRESKPILIVAGQPGWRAAGPAAMIERLVEEGHAIWLRDATDAALHALYRSATVLILPSCDEGFGLPAAEAMASGLPVVASNRGALPEVVADAGVLIDDDSPDAWATGIASLIDDTERLRRLAARGRERARRFTWTQTAEQTAQVYREVLMS